MFSMKMVLIHALVSQRVTVMFSDSFVSIVLPMSILLCSITSARIADIVDTCFFVKYLADIEPFFAALTHAETADIQEMQRAVVKMKNSFVMRSTTRIYQKRCLLGHLVPSKKHVTQQNSYGR